MSTVDKMTADAVILFNGVYPSGEPGIPDDPPVVKIVEYDTPSGATMYGLMYERTNPHSYDASAYVINPRTYWVLPKPE